MRNLRTLLFLAFALFITSQIEAKEWPIYCKGPISVTLKRSLGGLMSAGGLTITVEFSNPGKGVGAGYDRLSRGECSWPDRALRPDETINQGMMGCMVLDYGGNVETEFSINYQLMPDGSLKPFLNIIGGGMSDRLMNLKQDNRGVQVFLEGKLGNCMKITRIASN